ncbi:MAG: hypothetical protein COW84_09805 [Gammaproteobacteria bacterium CG22_combo_CG10-13_8_21_14_all_40_8]|nr:MAG: hypothetical protein COW84_09805 [Gammaproteobacteria bacterium CG22_combo_CG10-13_8_21_14_all_40_8]
MLTKEQFLHLQHIGIPVWISRENQIEAQCEQNADISTSCQFEDASKEPFEKMHNSALSHTPQKQPSSWQILPMSPPVETPKICWFIHEKSPLPGKQFFEDVARALYQKEDNWSAFLGNENTEIAGDMSACLQIICVGLPAKKLPLEKALHQRAISVNSVGSPQDNKFLWQQLLSNCSW